ncbi:MAG: hypothetical protein QOF96_2129, partial [Actinomycetota bacterium]|nr:hypothetical protein [Actinomycetota bacterium]
AHRHAFVAQGAPETDQNIEDFSSVISLYRHRH